MVAKYKRVVFHKKWLPTDGQAMHYNASCPDRTQSAIDALTDMYMLSKSNYLIYSGSSTFSYLSSVISSSPNGNMTDIERLNPVLQLKRTVKKLLV